MGLYLPEQLRLFEALLGQLQMPVGTLNQTHIRRGLDDGLGEARLPAQLGAQVRDLGLVLLTKIALVIEQIDLKIDA